jgi:hypothetical protein
MTLREIHPRAGVAYSTGLPPGSPDPVHECELFERADQRRRQPASLITAISTAGAEMPRHHHDLDNDLGVHPINACWAGQRQ